MGGSRPKEVEKRQRQDRGRIPSERLEVRLPEHDLMGNTVFDAIAIFLLIAPGRVLQNRSSTNSLQKPFH